MSRELTIAWAKRNCPDPRVVRDVAKHLGDAERASGHVMLLIGKKLYMSSPADINDPWDCQPHFDTRQVGDPAYRAALANYFAELSKRMPGGSKTPEQVAADIDAIRTSPDAALQMLRSQSQGMREGIARQWRLYCLTPHIDSELMWAHYGDCHRGNAVRRLPG